MIYPFDYHTHTVYCDGKNTPEEMVVSAIDKGMKAIGFSGHSYTAFDESYAMSEQSTIKYIEEIAKLKQKYQDKIEIYCGIEKDYYSTINSNNFDYCIGSVHYIKLGDKYYPIDESKDVFENIVSECFCGDYNKFAKVYFETAADLINKTNCDIIGHFDIFTKFNESNCLFLQDDKDYKAIALEAADSLLNQGAVFEVNTGAMARGYRTKPYPAKFILEYIKKRNGKLILSGDTHSINTLMFDFDNTIEYLKSIGFDKLMYIKNNNFEYLKI